MESSDWPKSLPRPGNQKLRRMKSAAPWFEVYQVSDATFALLEPRHYEEVISYLILGNERAVLLDTGMGIGAYECKEYINSLGGEIQVESASGGGTRMRVILPLAGYGQAVNSEYKDMESSA